MLAHLLMWSWLATVIVLVGPALCLPMMIAGLRVVSLERLRVVQQQHDVTILLDCVGLA